MVPKTHRGTPSTLRVHTHCRPPHLLSPGSDIMRSRRGRLHIAVVWGYPPLWADALVELGWRTAFDRLKLSFSVRVHRAPQIGLISQSSGIPNELSPI
ncbi:hypothetical protein DPEC_G00101720 [Dallia pectoralis]|uniref:Uncharacterized protein n=1 Tax=Dallia pectoralis TaxID=75939 RepID=A0ACC2GWK2_DALPE|nr:hypothetical protein DPEC_G00101720 [Dallia pectoralis]